MKEAMEKFEKAVDEMMDMCKAALGQFVFDEDMDDKALDCMRTSFKLVNASMELTKAQAEMMIEMNEKLDKLITR